MIYKDKRKTSDGKQWRYKCYYFDINGERKQKSSCRFLYKWEAEEAERLFLVKRDTPIHKKLGIIAQDYFNSIKQFKKESTYVTYIVDYNNHIAPYFENSDISLITVNSIKQWHEIMDKKDLSVKFKNKCYSIFKSIFDHGIKNFNLDKNPVSMYGRFQENKDLVIKEDTAKYLTLNEFKTFISFVDDEMWHCFFTFAFYTGCRKSEIFALNWNDVDLDNDNIEIYKTVSKTGKITSTKTNKNRTIKINKTLKNELVEYKKYVKFKYTDFENDWFVFGNGIPLAPTTVDRIKHYYFEKSNVKEIKMHEFRHSAVSLLLNAMLEQDTSLDINKALIILSTRFGHSPEVMIRIYGHLYSDRLQEPIINILDNL